MESNKWVGHHYAGHIVTLSITSDTFRNYDHFSMNPRCEWACIALRNERGRGISPIAPDQRRAM
jgi:hypothetical protein